MNAIRGTMRICAVKAPRYGEERKSILKDLAISVGADYISREAGILMKDVKIEHLGTSKSVEIGKSITTFVGGKGEGEAVEERIEKVKALLRQTDSDHEAKTLNERITRLASGVSVIRVGGATNVEMIETKHRIEDALEAVRSAQKDGITTGGGTALLRAKEGLTLEFENEGQALGSKILIKACEEPIRQLCRNSGVSEDIILAKVEECDLDEGYDFRTLSETNMYESGIVDPVKVTKTALINAVSAASTLLNTNHAIIQTD
jgi:chaperonin GroEL